MRAYLPSYERQFVVELHARPWRRHRRSHTVPRDQTCRRYDAGRARAEAREIIRAELRAYFQGLDANLEEQATAYIEMMSGEEINYLDDYFVRAGQRDSIEQWEEWDDSWEVYS